MPCKPWSESERAAVQGNFASRRGLAPISLSCDDSHLPFKPKGKKNFLEYRSFKGWTSILAVAFVDSYFRFFDVDVGYPGRAGDNARTHGRGRGRSQHATYDTRESPLTRSRTRTIERALSASALRNPESPAPCRDDRGSSDRRINE